MDCSGVAALPWAKIQRLEIGRRHVALPQQFGGELFVGLLELHVKRLHLGTVRIEDQLNLGSLRRREIGRAEQHQEGRAMHPHAHAVMAETSHGHGVGGHGLRGKRLGTKQSGGHGCDHEFVDHGVHSGSD